MTQTTCIKHDHSKCSRCGITLTGITFPTIDDRLICRDCANSDYVKWCKECASFAIFETPVMPDNDWLCPDCSELIVFCEICDRARYLSDKNLVVVAIGKNDHYYCRSCLLLQGCDLDTVLDNIEICGKNLRKGICYERCTLED